jgi:hypothetical protein
MAWRSLIPKLAYPSETLSLLIYESFKATHSLSGTPDQVRLSGLPDSEWLAYLTLRTIYESFRKSFLCPMCSGYCGRTLHQDIQSLNAPVSNGPLKWRNVMRDCISIIRIIRRFLTYLLCIIRMGHHLTIRQIACCFSRFYTREGWGFPGNFGPTQAGWARPYAQTEWDFPGPT